MTRILVAYATKHGSTGEIAERIGTVLRARGADMEVLPADQVRDVEAYDAVIVGSAVYMGRWQRDAIELLKHQERGLATRPTWLFSSGPIGGVEKADEALDEARRDPAAPAPPKEVAKRAERIGARGHATFAGRIGEEMTGLLERWMPRGDWREFDVIESWAGSVADALALAREAAPAPA